jgi:hypothetical protein
LIENVLFVVGHSVVIRRKQRKYGHVQRRVEANLFRTIIRGKIILVGEEIVLNITRYIIE